MAKLDRSHGGGPEINRFGRYTLKRERVPEPINGSRVLKMPLRPEGVGRAAIAAV